MTRRQAVLLVEYEDALVEQHQDVDGARAFDVMRGLQELGGGGGERRGVPGIGGAGGRQDQEGRHQAQKASELAHEIP